MSTPKLGERFVIAQHAARWSMAAARSRLASASGLGWRLVRARADVFLFIPPDMRPTDPSLADEIASGQMGLGGVMVNLAGGSPFGVASPDPIWAAALYSFTWLGSLRASEDPTALEVARRLVEDWCRRKRSRAGGHALAADPTIMARRVIAFIANAGFLLEDADDRFYTLFTRALGMELRALDRASRSATPGYPRLAGAMALSLGCLTTDGHNGDLPRVEARLLAELRSQILADGGHITRNPDVVLETLLDLLPIKQCYLARQLTPPAELTAIIDRMIGHVRAMTLTPGTLARFNGVGAARLEAVATVLALETMQSAPAAAEPGPSGYARLDRGGTTVIVDCGRAPPLVFSGAAHAGALSFEFAHEGDAIIVNGGTPEPLHANHTSDARATASHSTLVLDGQSSARLVHSGQVERLAAGPGLAGPTAVVASVIDVDGEARLVAQHDGYLSRYGVIHERRLSLDASGYVLEGVDVLRPPTGTLRLPRDVPLALHFHLPLEARWSGNADDGLLIQPVSGLAWRFTVSGARCQIEAATDFAQSKGPTAARQIVVRAATPGETTIHWRLERV